MLDKPLMRQLCFELVSRALPHEAPFFSFVWDSYTSYFGNNTADWCLERIKRKGGGGYFAELGAASDDTANLIEMGRFVAAIQFAGSKTLEAASEEVTHEDINTAIRSAISLVPRRLQPVFLNEGFQILCKAFRLQEIAGDGASSNPSLRNELYVEWWNNFDNGKVDEGAGYLPVSEVEEKFIGHEEKYTLFVNECDDGFWVSAFDVERKKSKAGNKFVNFDGLSEMETALLGIILMSRISPQYLRHDAIRRFTCENSGLSDSDTDEEKASSNARRQVAELNALTYGALKHFLRPVRGRRQYKWGRFVPYCWVRREKEWSRLVSVEDVWGVEEVEEDW